MADVEKLKQDICDIGKRIYAKGTQKAVSKLVSAASCRHQPAVARRRQDATDTKQVLKLILRFCNGRIALVKGTAFLHCIADSVCAFESECTR
jgi:hypothetical protein